MSEEFDFLGDIDLGDIVEKQAKLDIERKRKADEEAKRREEEARQREEEAKRREEERRNRGRTPSGGGDEPKKPKFEPLTFDDVIGMEDAKAQMMESIILPMKYGSIYERYNKRPVKGVLLYGPPGNGKTLLGKAVAHQMATLSGKEYTEDAFRYYSATEWLNMYVGQTERNIREAFQAARDFKARHGYRQVIFIDEPDVVFAKRGSYTGGGGAVNDGSVTAILTELDGMKELGAFVIIATNRPDSLDDAITRPGRIDRKVYCGRPLEQDCKQMFSYYLAKTKVEDVEALSSVAAECLYDESLVFMTIHTDEGDIPFTLKDIRSGAMIAGLVDQAVGRAIMRDIEASEASGETVEGFVGTDEVKWAIHREYEMSRHINHENAVRDLIGNKRVLNITRH